MKKIILGLWLSLWCSLAQAGVTCSLPFTLTNNTTADATQVMANYNALVTCLTNAAASGANNDITSLLALSTPIPGSAGGSSVYLGGTSTGSANAQVIAAPSPTGFSLAAKNTIIFIAGFTNTGATTIAVNGLGATNLFRQTPSGPQAMTGGEIISGQLIWATYDGTQFEMVSNGPQFGGFGPLIALASASTTNLGTVPTHNVNITGTTGITSFGSSASVTFPIYKLTFSASLTITYNATSMITPGTQNIVTQPNDTAEALYLGSGNWQIINYAKANGTAFNSPVPLCSFNALVIANGASNSIINWSFAKTVLINASGGNIPLYSTSQSGTINITTGTSVPTLGGMDGTTVGTNNFINLYAISNGASWSGLGSLNTTAPSLSGLTGYTYVCRMGVMKVNGSGNLLGTRILGNEARYVVGGANIATALPTWVTGNIGSACSGGSPVWVSTVVAGTGGAAVFIPSTAVAADLVGQAGNGDSTLVAPNTSYTGTSPPLSLIQGAGATTALSGQARILVETTSFAACLIAGNVYVYGWKDAVNAN